MEENATINDFGFQWTYFDKLDPKTCTEEALQNHFGPLYHTKSIKGLKTADIGSGAGCTVMMLINAGAGEVTAVEPSEAIFSCKKNTANYSDRIRYIQDTGDKIPLNNYDLITSIGVLHHIRNPAPVVRRIREALRPDGIFIAWIYGKENNNLYLSIAKPLRRLTTSMSDKSLMSLCRGLAVLLSGYAHLCRYLKLPMRKYMIEVILKQSKWYRMVTVFDQLNPTDAKYYSKEQARSLLVDNGFVDVRLYNRLGYSWTVMGRRPK